ncbi:nucleotidyltransferase domain-containing protein [Bifidobacterium sp. MA2]|uniref:Nucleotidyltransferase domain-containing protein n=1 Tax=Bifidobacterium santillanense TaxID=2809028 RepID=A0ABS5UMT1_9BIFI|nr:nucleotidyltransferase domain-containing protein [Bifidobacterium santillanense]MBT1172189.1 nucleotidyltransferase domain-containing protein [Bifidobacterium santillanense]
MSTVRTTDDIHRDSRARFEGMSGAEAPVVATTSAKEQPERADSNGAENCLSPARIASIARPIAMRNRIDELYLFGSMARGEATEDSDVDFIYQFSSMANPVIDLISFRDDLEGALHRRVDLVRKSYITEPQSDRLKEIQRVLFVNSITSKPMFRIL